MDYGYIIVIFHFANFFYVYRIGSGMIRKYGSVSTWAIRNTLVDWLLKGIILPDLMEIIWNYHNPSFARKPIKQLRGGIGVLFFNGSLHWKISVISPGNWKLIWVSLKIGNCTPIPLTALWTFLNINMAFFPVLTVNPPFSDASNYDFSSSLCHHTILYTLYTYYTIYYYYTIYFMPYIYINPLYYIHYQLFVIDPGPVPGVEGWISSKTKLNEPLVIKSWENPGLRWSVDWAAMLETSIKKNEICKF